MSESENPVVLEDPTGEAPTAPPVVLTAPEPVLPIHEQTRQVQELTIRNLQDAVELARDQAEQLRSLVVESRGENVSSKAAVEALSLEMTARLERLEGLLSAENAPVPKAKRAGFLS